MIFECGPHGADKKVCEYLARKLNPALEIESITLDRKDKLITECGREAQTLLENGCQRVVIIWDLYPAWRENNEKPCRKEDRENIFKSLNAYGVDISRVFLVCIKEELEAWLLADNRALEEVLSKPHRKIRVDRIRHPERVDNPKKKLSNIYREKIHRAYNDLIDAEKIIKAIPDFDRLASCESFIRFAQKVADINLNE